MKKTLSVLLVTLLLIFTLTAFCACGNNDNNKNIDENGTLSDDAKDIIDDGDLDMNDNATNNGNTNNTGTTNNTTTDNGTANDTTGNTTDDATK